MTLSPTDERTTPEPADSSCNGVQRLTILEMGLDAAQLRVIAALVGGASVTAAAAAGGVNRVTVWRWQDADPDFVAELNRLRQEQRDAIRSGLRDLAADALVELRTLVTSPGTPPAVRLKAIGMVLGAAGVMAPEPIGPVY